MKKLNFTLQFLLCALLFFTCKSAYCGTSADPSIQKMVKEMTIRQKIGQVLVMDFRCWETDEIPSTKITRTKTPRGIKNTGPVVNINPFISKAVSTYHIGNIILFAENTPSLQTTLNLTYNYQKIAAENHDVPMLIGIDQEGGRVNRYTFADTFPAAYQFGQTNDSHTAYLKACYISRQLKALNINLNFDPCCDVFSNPDNQVIGNRSFSSNPETVSQFSLQAFRGYQNNNIISCAKHFPGHGDTVTDSHEGLPLAGKSRKEISDCEFLPFKELIKSGIPMIMVAHIQVPSLDKSLVTSDKKHCRIIPPASLSKKIITNVLRKELGFDGVVITDALDMGAVSEYFTESTAVILALNAGADLLCMPLTVTSSQDLIRLEALYQDIETALQKGILSKNRLDQAVTRVLTLKKEYGVLNLNITELTKKDLLNAKSSMSRPEYKDLIKNVLSN